MPSSERAGWPAVILPVRDGEALLGPALAVFVRQAADLGGRVVVVDDCSRDASAAVAAAAGAEVVRLTEPSGPYVARNAGWRHAGESGAGVAVFVDVRCRPRPGWLGELLAALDAPGAALAAGEVAVLPRAHLAGRAAVILEPLALRHGRDAAFLPYAPTCHLAAPIDVLEAVGGFKPVRGGGDVAFCWEVQLAGLGEIAWAEGAVLDWEPRRSVRDLLAQHRRYGANSARLHRSFEEAGCPVSPATPVWRARLHAVRAVLAQAPRTRPSRWGALAVAEAARAVHAIGYATVVDDAGAERSMR